MYVMCNLVIRTLTENAGMENHRLNSKAGKGRNRVKSRQGTAALRRILHSPVLHFPSSIRKNISAPLLITPHTHADLHCRQI